MKFGVIYSFDTAQESSVSWFYPRRPIRRLFKITEDDDQAQYEDLFGPRFKHRKLVSRDLLTQEQFDLFVQDTELLAEDVETGGSLTGGAWGLGYWVPAVSFNAYRDNAIVGAYVTPVPDVALTREADDERMEHSWQRVRRAVINVYK